MALVDEIGGRLSALGHGQAGVDMFYGELPDDVDNCIALFPYGGKGPIKSFGGGRLSAPSIQVKVRNTSMANGEAKAIAIFQALDGFTGTLSGTRFLRIDAIGSPGWLGRDGLGRGLWSLNFSTIKEG